MAKSILSVSFFFLFLFILPATSFAQAAESVCYLKERNPDTGTFFTDERDYQERLQAWKENSPGLPNPFALLKAYSVYKSEMAQARKLGQDKRMHCYLGCRISQETNYRTAEYVGWLKEERDLSDCKTNTRFEEEDYVVTLRGAQVGESDADPASCLRACR